LPTAESVRGPHASQRPPAAFSPQKAEGGRFRPVLTIAGSDSGGGAGIQADARTIEALGGFAVMAVTAITAQNLHGVRAWRAVEPGLIAAQIEAVLEDFAVGAVKTGLLPGAAAVRAVSAALSGKHLPLVIDPVLASTSGTRFLSQAAVAQAKKELFPLATLITPNWPEAAELSGLPIGSVDQAEFAAAMMVEAGCAAVLVKGGHGPGKKVCDVLVTSGGLVQRFASPRVATKNTHGTGCTLSAAIATYLAQGETLPEAVGHAREYLIKVLTNNRSVRWGDGLRGPVGS
jgi:hydroxymethylpyrimidine/phosphomethylpyrimidine kinase